MSPGAADHLYSEGAWRPKRVENRVTNSYDFRGGKSWLIGPVSTPSGPPGTHLLILVDDVWSVSLDIAFFDNFAIILR